MLYLQSIRAPRGLVSGSRRFLCGENRLPFLLLYLIRLAYRSQYPYRMAVKGIAEATPCGIYTVRVS